MTAGGERKGGRVTVVAKSTAVGVKPVRAGKTHPLSAPDHAMGRHTLHLVYYYRPSPALDRERLLESLSEVLSYYPAMTGRLTWQHHEPQEETAGAGAGAWVVKCNDAGVRMVDARADATLEEWLRTASDEEEMELAYWEPMGPEPYVWSPYYIQITEFKDKGPGPTPTGAPSSPTILSSNPPPSTTPHPPPPPADQTIPDYPPPPLLSLKSANANANADTNSPPPSSAFSSATFRFSTASLRRLLSDLSPQTETLSPFAALASLFWVRIASASSSSSSPAAAAAEGEAALTLGVDFRKRMSAPLPMGYYGNAVFFSRARADLSRGWAHAAAELDRHVAELDEGRDVWAHAQWLRARPRDAPFQMYGPELTCVALDHVPAYAAEFEAGVGPAHAAFRIGGAEGEGLIVVAPSPPEAGDAARTVTLTLPSELTAQICRDDHILRYGPAIMFAPPKI
ncbi:Protein ECERIFERUM 26 [Ananas comosus]|uniref:Protein ECERIFERUM 26 n=1 Tax=Ananas comosus TaxID=4615 RepID=A0A199VFE1_ANACO|nr:Protein ECERIFERUM 26 [Ananas comosus]